MPSIQQLQLNAGNYSQSQRCRTRIGDLRLRKEMFRLDIKKRFWTVWAKWLNSWGRLWKLQQCSYQRSARTLAGSKSLGIMKTKFSHNLVPCFQTQLCWFLTLLYRLTGTDVYYVFSGLIGHSINSLSQAKLTPATVYEKEFLQLESSIHDELCISL